MSDLLPVEVERLAALEAKVEEGIAAFITTGEALREIRDDRLYREDYANFKDYLDARWAYSRTQAHQLIEAAEVASLVRNCEQVEEPRTESHARALVPLKGQTELLQTAAQAAQETAASENRPVTASDYAQAVEVVRDLPSPPPVAKVRDLVGEAIRRKAGADTRFGIVTTIAGLIDSSPAPADIWLPTDPGNVAALDAALPRVRAWVDAMTDRWDDHLQTIERAA